MLLFVDKNVGLNTARAALSTLAAPFYWVTNLPSKVNQWGDDNLVSRERLMAQNEALRARVLLLEASLAKHDSIVEENTRLRELLNASEALSNRVVASQMIGVVPDPVRQVLVIDKGSDDEVRIGHAVIDQFGVAGQVIEVTSGTAHVLLITDSSHALPVRIAGSGVRSVAQGAGDIDSLSLAFVPNTAEVNIGDHVYTSGLGDVFPEGYPVGEVSDLSRDLNQPFLELTVRPFAQLNRSRFFMVLIPEAGGQPEELIDE